MRLRLAALILTAGAGQGLGQTRSATVDVYINAHDDSEQLLGPSKLLASDLFKKIGVRLNWHKGEMRAGQGSFGIRTVDHAPESATQEALASSRLLASSGVEITVYEDRIRQFLHDHRSVAEVATAYVLAHELAHVMQGVDRHSESGILKAHWSAQDLKEMAFQKLAFTTFDIGLIHEGLARQMASGRPEPADKPESGRPTVSNLGKR